ncbi:DedA family protein [Cytobacillus gottheilii]|uniref:DedA family protein n=1 Tax=Cytobacillus gottheilii TaxID=859144 RepID=A0ABX8FCE6_9BACI|nr:DedA family protein [Cytobacillus gottheilii]QVY61750.1 DedA family protein [Cytobacillus gottheilii]
MEALILEMIEAFKGLSYFGIMLALTFEFVPAELVLPLAGFWVYEGDMNLYGAIIAGSIGGVLGPLTLYALGRYGGRPVVLKFGKYFLVKEEHIDKADEFFAKYGGAVAFLGRFIPGVRTAISIPCGMAKMNIWKFIIYTYVAMLPVTAIYVYLGYVLGPQWERAGAIFAQYANYLLIPIALFLIWFVFTRLRKRKI